MTEPIFPVQTWPAGRVLFAAGAPPLAMYLIESGEVDLTTADGSTCRLGSGDVFGEQSVFGGTGRGVRAEAATDLVCTVIDIASLNAMLRTQKSLARPVVEAVMLQMFLHHAIRSTPKR